MPFFLEMRLITKFKPLLAVAANLRRYISNLRTGKSHSTQLEEELRKDYLTSELYKIWIEGVVPPEWEEKLAQLRPSDQARDDLHVVAEHIKKSRLVGRPCLPIRAFLAWCLAQLRSCSLSYCAGLVCSPPWSTAPL
jgi:hypothetical protein